jgi:starvation-inducible DNA-binding protein
MTEHYSPEDHTKIVDALKGYLADNAIVYYKAHAFHWNVEGPNFYSFHLFFEKIYTELWESLDEVAERIRAFGDKAPPNFLELLKGATIGETETSPQSYIMARILKDDFLVLSKRAYEVGSIAESIGDRVTMDMMTQKGTSLEKTAWMLNSTIVS